MLRLHACVHTSAHSAVLPAMSSSPPRRLLVETPPTLVSWNAALLANESSGIGLSGTHTALLALAERFAHEGWEAFLIGSVVPPSSPSAARGVTYVPSTRSAAMLAGLTFDLTLVSTSLFRAPIFDTFPTDRLCIVMEMQSISASDAKRLHAFSAAQRARQPSYDLVFAHLSPWGASLVPRFAPAWVRTAAWVRHVQWRNPVEPSPHPRRGGAREPGGFIFPACLERGGAVAARVYARVRDGWGAAAARRRGAPYLTYGSYAPPNRLYEEERRAIEAAAGRGADVSFARLSKAALRAELRRASFFVYGLASARGVAHLDTFANAVAEALAAGVIVLAPPLGALPSVYADGVTWVTPPGGISPFAAEAYTPLRVAEIHPEPMVERYVAAVQALLRNGTARAAARARGERAVRRYTTARVTGALYRLLVDCPRAADAAAREECERRNQRYD